MSNYDTWLMFGGTFRCGCCYKIPIFIDIRDLTRCPHCEHVMKFYETEKGIVPLRDSEGETIMTKRKSEKSAYPIGLGDKGEIIKDIQERLALLGSKVKVTGEFNIGTLSAVKSWQKKNKLQVSGKVSAFQYNKLIDMTDPLKKPEKKTRKR